MIEVRLEPSLLIAGEHNAVTILVTNSSPATCSRIIVKLSFPSDLILTEGSPSIEVQRLAGGRSSEHRIGIAHAVPARGP